MSFLPLMHQQLAITGNRTGVDLSIIRIISSEHLIVDYFEHISVGM